LTGSGQTRIFCNPARDRPAGRPGARPRDEGHAHPARLRHKFVEDLAGLPGVRITRKPDSWRRWHADSALVEQAGTRYILVAPAEHPDGGQWLARPGA
jgi:hypothetical protein